MGISSIIARLGRWFQGHVWNWVTLHEFREIGAVKYSWVWLALVPFLMRLVVAWQPKVALALDVPVNFVLCYLAGLFFLLAMVPAKACPILVKRASSYGAFVQGQHSEVELRNWFREVVPAPVDPAEADPVLVLQYLSIVRGYDNLTAPEMAERLSGRAGHAIMDPFWATPAGARLPNVHNFALGIAKHRQPTARTYATLAYVIGFLFLGGVLLYNGFSAYRYFTRPPAPESTGASFRDAIKRRLSDADISRAAALLDGNTRCRITISYHNGDAVGGALANDLSRLLDRAGFPPSVTQAMDSYTTEAGITIRTTRANTRRETVVALQAALRAVGLDAAAAVDPAIPLEPGTEVEIHIAN